MKPKKQIKLFKAKSKQEKVTNEMPKKEKQNKLFKIKPKPEVKIIPSEQLKLKKQGKRSNTKSKTGETEEVVEDESKPKNKKESDVLQNKTVFIRNLDFDTTEEDLAELLKIFGDLEYCKVCLDSYTQRSRGTAFVKFKTIEGAQSCLAEAQQAESSLKLYIDGRQLNIAMAVPREQVNNIQQQNDPRRKKKDKRNLYLAREGLIYPNSPAAAGVSQSDLQKRLAVSFEN